ncbi:hypothetical protein HMPREF9406_4136 [Clostridium sp. HGF2]|nr:hypothetical protein HMPREF9406_4136 [Clostridium sp. HGF2]EQJ51635.1 hypothetical protein QSI_4268 [Clostridioides difficile P28]
MRFHKVWSSTVSMRRLKALPWIHRSSAISCSHSILYG